MGKITFQEFTTNCGKAIVVLLSIIFYCIYLYFRYGYDITNTIIFISSILCVVGLVRILKVGERAIANKEYVISIVDSIVLELLLIIIIGVLSIYIFAFKGVYGIYKSFENFSFWAIILDIGIIMLSYQLVTATYIVQNVFKAIRLKSITLEEKQ